MPERAPDITPDSSGMIPDILGRNVMAGARLMRAIEAGNPQAGLLLGQLYPHGGNAFVIGITGPPGAGKSTLISALITCFRQKDLTVGVVAVDPSSAQTGGAVLGDRVRMQAHAGDPGVFIRSLAARGAAGGLARAARDICLVLDAMKYDVIIVEPVGSGQADMEICRMVHSLGLVAIPGAGDGIQSVKAGLLEAADIFIVNKNDLPGATSEVMTLEHLVKLRSVPPDAWQAPVMSTCARTGQGVDRLAERFLEHRGFMTDHGLLKKMRADQAADYFTTLVRQMVLDRINPWMDRQIAVFQKSATYQADVAADPYRTARKLANRLTACLNDAQETDREF
ncbi:MAG: methylmalonyl Co-A mutase-associated GTPase MeaB [Desulfotignum sp.]